MEAPVRRSELTCPAHSRSMMEKAAASDADEVIFDLEDACARSQKESARRTLVETLPSLVFTGGKVRAYRVNGVGTPWFEADLKEVLTRCGAHLDGVVVPKVSSAAQVEQVDRLMTEIETAQHLPAGRLKIEALIETASGLLDAPAIAKASPRMASLIFGVADFAGEIGAKGFQSDPHGLMAYARSHILVAARAAGIDAIDGVTVQFKDLAPVTRDAQRAAEMGFDGKWAIHPAQLEPIHRAFTPTLAELERAARIVEAYTKADQRDGLGAIAIGDEMIDAATLKVERRKLAIAQRASVPR